MKKLIYLGFILLFFTISLSKGQVARPNPVGELLTDFSTQASDTLYKFVFVGRLTSEGSIYDAHIIIDSIDCNDSWYMVGASNVNNKAPVWYPSIGEFAFPAIIDTTALNSDGRLKYRQLPYDDSWTFQTKIRWNSQYMVFAIYKGGCTKGTAYLYY